MIDESPKPDHGSVDDIIPNTVPGDYSVDGIIKIASLETFLKNFRKDYTACNTLGHRIRLNLELEDFYAVPIVIIYGGKGKPPKSNHVDVEIYNLDPHIKREKSYWGEIQNQILNAFGHSKDNPILIGMETVLSQHVQKAFEGPNETRITETILDSKAPSKPMPWSLPTFWHEHRRSILCTTLIGAVIIAAVVTSVFSFGAPVVLLALAAALKISFIGAAGITASLSLFAGGALTFTGVSAAALAKNRGLFCSCAADASVADSKKGGLRP